MDYFLGGQSPSGFRTNFGRLISDKSFYTYILKGGAGSGKSTLMRSLAEHFDGRESIDLYRCASDLHSIDAVVLNRSKIIVVDGTAPHTFDPIYPAVCQEIVNLGEFWDSSAIAASGERIIAVSDENKRLHMRSQRFVSALSALCSDTLHIAADALNTEKLEKFSERLTKKIVGKGGHIQEGTPYFRQLSAITQDGYVTCPPPSDYTVYILNDAYHAGASALLRSISEHILRSGYDVVISESYMFQSPQYEHILIPELKTAVMTSSSFNGFTCENKLPVNMQRFYFKQELSSRKQRISFNRRGARELGEEAALSIAMALEIHNELEGFYSPAMNFEAIKPVSERITEAVEERLRCNCQSR